MTFAYTGWAAYASLYVFRPRDRRLVETSLLQWQWQSVFTACTCIALVVFWAVFAIERAPLTYSVYVAFPLYFWHQFLGRASKPILSALESESKWRPGDVVMWVARAGVVVAALLAMVVCRVTFELDAFSH